MFLGEWAELLTVLADAIQMAEQNSHPMWAPLFTLTTAGLQDRSYTSISQAREDGNNARVWGGMHFPSTVTISDANGNVTFLDVIPGEYIEEVVAPAGYYLTGDGEGGDPTLDSDVDPEDGTGTAGLRQGLRHAP